MYVLRNENIRVIREPDIHKNSIRVMDDTTVSYSIYDWVCENRFYLYIQFYDFEDTQLLSLWVSWRYTNLTLERLSIGV